MATRAAMVYVASAVPALRHALASILAVFAVGIVTLYAANVRDNGPFGGPVWWHHLRLLHGALWGVASLLLFTNNPQAAASVLAVDQAIGFGAFLEHHFGDDAA